jgi:hydrogenase-4 component E
VTREIEPYVGYVASLVSGVLALGVSFWMCTRLPMPEDIASPWLAPVAFFSIFAGLFLIVSRKRAVNQVLGFLVLENGIYTFGVGVAARTPLLVEAGVLLDVFVAVFVMGITIFHINREFDHIDVDRLSTLKDS